MNDFITARSKECSYEELLRTLPDAEMVPIFTQLDGQYPNVRGHAAIRDRADANRVFSVVSDRYKLIRHQEVIERVFEVMDKVPGVTLLPRARITNQGAQVRLDFPFGEAGAVVSKDMVQPSLTIMNSYDLSLNFGLYVGAMRLVCSNGLMAWTQHAGARHRHIGKVRSFIEPGDVGRMIEVFATETAPLWSKAATLELTFDEAENVYSYAENQLSMPTMVVKAAKEIWQNRFAMAEEERGNTAWIVYNTFTNAITHNRMRRRNDPRTEILPVAKEKTLQEVAGKLLQHVVNGKGLQK